MNKEEKRKKHLSELNTARRKRYVELHKMKQFKVELTSDEFENIDSRLKADGISKKEFVLKSFEQYVKNNGF